MMTVCFCLAIGILFLVGFLAGYALGPLETGKSTEKTISALQEDFLKNLQEEYNYFLTYDGSEQS